MAGSYRQKMRQADREARATVAALGVVVVAWVALGFGLAGSGIELFHTPLWVLGGTVGTWLVALVCCWVLARFVIEDCDLGVEGDADCGADHD